MSDCREEAQDWQLYVEDMIELRERVFTTAPTPPDAPTAPSPAMPNPPTKPVLSPSKGTPNARAPARRPASRFTSKCRKMSQNVALFHTPTRRMAYFTSKKPHVFSPFPAILAHFRSFPAFEH